MLNILSQQVVKAEANIFFLIFAYIAALFVISALIEKLKSDKEEDIRRQHDDNIKSIISEAEEIIHQYPDGARKVIGNIPSSISYDIAKIIVNERWRFESAQRTYDEDKIKKRNKDKADSIRKSCPDVCRCKTDEYIANNEAYIYHQQELYKKRKEEAKTIYAKYSKGVSAVCGCISDSYMTVNDVDKILSNKSKIIAEHQRIKREEAELEKLKLQLSEFQSKYPIAVRRIVHENGWSLTNVDDVRLLLKMPGTIAERQEKEENHILSSSVLLDRVIKRAKSGGKYKNKYLEIDQIKIRYGAKIAAKVLETIEAEDKYKAISDFLDSVAKAQNDFASETRSLIPDYFSGWAWYYNEFSVKYTDSIGNSKTNILKIWQPFHDSCCFDDSVSYEYYPNYKNNRIFKPQLEGTYSYTEESWTKVLSFINKLNDKYGNELFVVLANTDNLSSSSFENNFKTIKKMLSDAGISYGFKVPQNTSRSSNRTYIILDIITEKSNLVKYCEDIFQFRYGTEIEPNQGLTRIVFITMLRCFDGSEVEELNKKAIEAKEEEERKAREEAERKRHEKEQKMQDEKDILRAKTIARSFPIGFRQFFPDQSTVSISAYEARSIIQRESSIMNFQDTISRMTNCVSNWKSASGVPHWFFYYYYPTRFKDVSMDSQSARKLIYNFKDGISHNTVKDLVVNKLRSTFSSYDLSQMTFVCIPASTRVVHESRYKSFAEDVTQALGMLNAYDYITITKEKTPSRLGGSDYAEYSFNSSFFQEKFVILFDDVVTSGGSIASMKSTLESIGASVICALSIGRTYSDWNGNPRQPHPHTGRL